MFRAIILISLLASGAWAICCNDDQVECMDYTTRTANCIQLESPSPVDPAVNCTNFCPGQCSEGEMACSAGTDMNGCAHADNCVSKTVKGWNGTECERTSCDIECGAEEQLCDAGYNMDGCPMPMECKPMKNSYMDPATMETVECWPGCPTICGLDKMTCPGVSDGCMENTDCVSKTVSGYHGQECERMSCDATCGPEEELCDAGYDMDGCPMAKVCQPTKNSYMDPATMETVECWPGCPTICKLDMMTCPGVSDACGAGNTCVSKTVMGYHGQECERMSCDPTCGPEEKLCDSGFDMDGCPMAKVCQPRKSSGWDPVTNSEVECWNACQTICGPDQMSCDSTDANGCQKPRTCVDNTSMSGGEICYGFCPLECGADMMACSGGKDATGCEIQGTCVMMGDSCPSDAGYTAP